MKWILCVTYVLLIILTFSNAHAESVRLDDSALVITEQDIKARHFSTVYDVLKSLPGIDIVRQGGTGKEVFIFMRGAEARHTLVLIDGVSVNNPATGGFNLADLPADNIERIEIVYGPLSPVYGSDAIGGVVHIFTKQATVSSGTISIERGSFGTDSENISASVKKDAYDLTLAASTLDTDGFSAASSGSENDGYQSTYISSRLGIQRGALTRIDITAILAETENDLDNFDLDDPNYEQHRRWSTLGFNYSSPLTKNWTQKITMSRSNDQLVGLDENTDLNRSFATMNVKTLGWHHNVRSTDGNILTMGYEWQEKEAELKAAYKKSFSNNAVYLQENRAVTSSANLVTSLRWDKGTINDGILSYRFGIAYRPAENVTWRFKYGTGFKFPNIEDLLNNDLKPEKSHGWEAGVEEFVSDNFFISLSYYNNTFQDLIQNKQNISDAVSKGIEILVNWRVSTLVSLKGNYTYNDTEDMQIHKQLYWRPLNKYSATLQINPYGRFGLDLNMIHAGKRGDISNIDLSPYTRIDLLSRLKINKTIGTYIRIENLLDEDYEEAAAYNTPGFSTYGGIQMSF